ncbi:MAG: VCBS repeat-containing protein [Flavobacteriales bacterium]|nr:VCBS repeat-containing protein [Flavobacteriales bacterium]MEB2341636.1 FG-GAP-like repeat-containing protein [Flavobacteriia bacterium]
MQRPLLLLAIAGCTLQAQAQGTCATAVPVTLATYYVAQIDGSQAPSPICTGGGAATMGRWYVYTADMDTAITVNTDLPQNNGRDTRVHIYTGTCANLACYAGDDDSGTGYTAVVTFEVTAGTSYYIAFDDRWTGLGFTFEVKYAAAPPPTASFTSQYINTNGVSYCVVDMDGDGLDDAVSVTATSITINYQQAGGGFTNVTRTTTDADYMPNWSLCAGDLDGNGYTDLVYAGSGVTFMLANDDGLGFTELSQPQYIFCQRSNMVDINNDGELDLFVCHDVQPNVYYLNNGDGTFTWHQGGLGDQPDGGNYGSIWIDYNNDGNVDLFIAKCRGAGSPASIDELWRNNGDGTFTNVASAANFLADFHQSWSSAWADYDNDGDLDVLIGASSFSGGGHKLLRNDGNDQFTNVTTGSGFDLFNGLDIEFIARDFDNDGYVDVLGAGELLHNNGDMTFTLMQVPFNNGPTGDLNNDGFVDVQNGNTVYFNAGNANNWVKVVTKGTLSNANGIGARVEIETPSGNQIRDIVSGDGFRYMSTLTAMFGIGADTEIGKITVRWPSGIVNVVNNPDINTTITVVEDEANDVSTGIERPVLAELGLFPSPAHSTLTLTAARDLHGSLIRITDLAGKVVATTTLVGQTIDISRLAGGLYILRAQAPTGTLSGKFIKE